MRIITDIHQEKENFVKWQLFILTISASFSRANIYLPEVDEKQRIVFKKYLFDSLERLSGHYRAEVSEDRHIAIISDFIQDSTKFSHILQDGMLRYGVAQKMVNLYFKYLWCAGYISHTPKHFPLDRLIQKGTPDIINWTQLTEEEDHKYLAKLNELCPGEDKAEWELREYNKQFYK